MIDDLVSALWRIREEKRECARVEKELNQRYAEAKSALFEALADLGLNKVGDGLKTSTARVTITEKEVINFDKDQWTEFCDYIKEHNAFHLVAQSPASKACKEHCTITGDSLPGVTFTVLRDISMSTR